MVFENTDDVKISTKCAQPIPWVIRGSKKANIGAAEMGDTVISMAGGELCGDRLWSRVGRHLPQPVF